MNLRMFIVHHLLCKPETSAIHHCIFIQTFHLFEHIMVMKLAFSLSERELCLKFPQLLHLRPPAFLQQLKTQPSKGKRLSFKYVRWKCLPIFLLLFFKYRSLQKISRFANCNFIVHRKVLLKFWKWSRFIQQISTNFNISCVLN